MCIEWIQTHAISHTHTDVQDIFRCVVRWNFDDLFSGGLISLHLSSPSSSSTAAATIAASAAASATAVVA